MSDGKANPIKYFASFGIGGKGLLPGRCQDTFGVGYYHAWFSNQIPDIAYRFLLNGNEQGGKLYYNIHLTPWVQITPDLQIIQSADQRVDNTVIVGGLRMQLNFSRLMKNAHLRRFPHPSSLRRTMKYASLLRISGALHLGIFDQPERANFSTTG